MKALYRKISLLIKVLIFVLYSFYQNFSILDFSSLEYHLSLFTPNSILIITITSFVISFVFSLQIAKEFLYLNAIHLVGAILSTAFIRELSPVLTSVVVIGRVCSLFTSQLASMVVTEQIDALLVIGINPIIYLIIPRIIAMLIGLPILNLISIFTSLIGGSFICFSLYRIHPSCFFNSVIYDYFCIDLLKSLFKTAIFAISISMISCIWGITSKGGSQGIGLSTTSSVVICLIAIFILNFLLSYYLFNNQISLFQFH
uniref:ABC transporter permease n=1 Tax=Chondria sp. (in: red algae) TaxID=1982705 RepID=A0A1Z1MDP1_9FLOR|nr:hypothetical protein [Chondria sp. (in: red algae)]